MSKILSFVDSIAAYFIGTYIFLIVMNRQCFAACCNFNYVFKFLSLKMNSWFKTHGCTQGYIHVEGYILLLCYCEVHYEGVLSTFQIWSLWDKVK